MWLCNIHAIQYTPGIPWSAEDGMLNSIWTSWHGVAICPIIQFMLFRNRKIILTFFVMPLVFLIAMAAVQLIPNSWVSANIKTSRDIIGVETIYHDAYHVPSVHWLAASDGYSDDIYLQEQVADRSHGILYDAMIPGYDRYWHGYSIFLRPLLVFFDLSYIRQILVICFIVLAAILVHLIIKHVNFTVGILFAIALALVNPPVIMISLQFSNMFLLMLIASIVLLLLLAKKRPMEEIFMFFAVVGSLTSFFDLLTTPVITLGIPLLLFVAYRLQHEEQKDLLRHVCYITLLWGGGYLISWAAKWLIGSLILQRNIFLEATAKVTFWSSDYSAIVSHNVSAPFVLWQWIKRLVLYWPVLIVALVGFVVALTRKLKVSQQTLFTGVSTIGVLSVLIPTLLPIIWLMVARQHSFAHQWFSYRHLIILIFGTFVLMWYLTRKAPTRATLTRGKS